MSSETFSKEIVTIFITHAEKWLRNRVKTLCISCKVILGKWATQKSTNEGKLSTASIFVKLENCVKIAADYGNYA